MRPKKKEEDKKINFSITISPIINEIILDNTSNRSRYIEYTLLEYFKTRGLDTSKIKL